MEFSANAPVLFVLAGIIIAAVLAQSVFFLVKAWRRAREIGMDMGRLKKTARTAAIFTIAPAVAIVISVMTLSKDLGVALPWLRLSVVDPCPMKRWRRPMRKAPWDWCSEE